MNQEKIGSELFYDTYALYAIATGKESYFSFLKGYKINTSLLNLYEFYYILAKENQIDIAEAFFNRLINNCLGFNSDNIKEAAKFRLKNIKKKFSYLDCLGYIVAKNNNMKFLTGDDAFNGFENVEFVK